MTSDTIDDVVEIIRSSPRYRQIDESLVRHIATQELAKGRSPKEAVKAARSKLHQVAGAYVKRNIDYDRWAADLQQLPGDLSDPGLQDFCRRMMAQHASTRERLPFLEHFYLQTTAALAPVRSVLDVGCGLNALSLPWMPLADGGTYFGCDIYSDMASFLNQFLAHTGSQGQVETCDLSHAVPSMEVHLALLLKIIPCLEHLDRTIGLRLLDTVQAEHLLVSFPARSLGGREKGMIRTYEMHFQQLAAGKNWQICP